MRKLGVFAAAVLVIATCLAGTASAQWQQTNGPFSPCIRAFCVKGTDVLAGTGTGLFRSSDQGLTWSRISDGLSDVRVWSVVAKGDYLYAGTKYGGVFRSRDYGLSWSQCLSGLFLVRGLAVVGQDIYASSSKGVHRSSDDGNSWQQMNTGLPSDNIGSVVYTGTGLLVTTTVGVYRMLNNDTTWTPVLPSVDASCLAVDGGDIYVGTVGQGIYRSSDGGATWTTHASLGKAIYGVSASGGSVYAATWGGVYRSQDRGVSWVLLNSGLTSLWVNTVVVNDNVVLAGTEGSGISRTYLDSTGWSEANRGFQYGSPVTIINAMLAFNDSCLLAGSTNNGAYVSPDAGDNWYFANNGFPEDKTVAALSSVGARLYATLEADGLYVSEDGGASWSPSHTGFSELWFVKQYSDGALAGTELGLFRTTDTGVTWSKVSSFGASVRGLDRDGESMLAATCGAGVFRTVDGGLTWTSSSDGLTDISVLSMVRLNGATFVGTAAGGVFVSTDGGSSWSKHNTGLTNLRVLTLVTSGNYVLAGTDGGIFRSPGSGARWIAVDSGMTYRGVHSFVTLGSSIFATTNGAGVWKMPVAGLTCCTGSVGDIDVSGNADLSDLSCLVSFLTGGGYKLPCQESANVNGSGLVDLTDLSALVNYLTGGGYTPPSCP